VQLTHTHNSLILFSDRCQLTVTVFQECRPLLATTEIMHFKSIWMTMQPPQLILNPCLPFYINSFPRVAFGPVYLLGHKIMVFVDDLELLGFQGSASGLRPSIKHREKIQLCYDPTLQSCNTACLNMYTRLDLACISVPTS